MANLIDFGDPQPKSQNTHCASNKLFGVIKRECFAVEVAGMGDGVGETLQPGILIQIIPDYRGDQCHFKIRNFTNWQDKYKTVIYKCTKDDFIVVTGELWPYLLALKNDEGRVKLVQNVYNKKFDLDMVKLGSDIRIRGPPGTVEKYYEFRVAYNGVVKEIGTGYYIGLQLKSDGVSLTSDLKCLSRYYRFGGTTGIVVPLDWIMLNVYKEEVYYYEPRITPLGKMSSDVEIMITETAAEAQENSFKNVQEHSFIIEQRKKPNETGVLPKILYSAPNCGTDTTLTRPMNVHSMKSFETGATSKKSNQPDTTTSNFGELNKMLEEMEMEPNYGSKNIENNYLWRTTIIAQPAKTIEGAMSTQLPDGFKTEFNNNTVIEIETMKKGGSVFEAKNVELKDGLMNFENRYVSSTPPIILQRNKTIEPDGMSIRIQSPEHPKTEFNNNAVGPMQMRPNDRMKNVENSYVRTSPLIVQPNKTIEPDGMSIRIQSPENPKTEFNNNAVGPMQMRPNDQMKNVENNYVRTSPLIVQPNKTIEPDGMSTRNHQNPKIQFNNNAAGPMQMRPNDRMKNSENNFVRTSPNEIAILPRQHHQPTENSSYVAEIELIGNLDGAVRNVEKTKCDLCSATVEIGHGIILRECLHSFCTRCITIHVGSNLNHSGIRCPYKKDYECEFDLQDAEIKDLGGEIVYNKILENRLKEYVGADPNATRCPNMDCGYVWVNVQREHKNYEHCPECNAGWCFVCQSSHERGERHGNNSGKFTLYNKIKSKIFGIDSTEPTVVCAKCRMTIISATEYVRLQKCNHIFCKSCILPMIKSQTSGSRYAQCAVCNSNLEDKELAKIAGLEVLNLFLGNRKLQKDSDVLQEMCICGPSVSNCSVELKCKHKFCRTYIVGLVQEQLSSSHRAACPRCLQEIDKSQIRRIVPGLIKEENIETCKLCANQVDVHLEICKHGFCHKCVRVMITKQVFDPSEKNVTCTSCHEHITDREISMYGSDKIFAQYKSKFEDFKFIPKSASPTKTCVCKPQNINCRFTLKCGHTFCRTYIADIVKTQLNNKGAACPTCDLEIDKIEIGYLVPRPIENEVVNKCQNCSNQAGVRLTNCQHRFCRKCLQNIITTQVFDPKKSLVTCTSCDENVTDREILTYGSEELFARYKTKLGATPKPIDDHITLTEKQFECDICEKQIPIKGGIILAGCSHWFCIDCCKELIDRQFSIPKQPVCSICLKELAQYEIEALIGKPTQITPNDNSTLVECLKCEQKFDERLIQKCSKCAKLICLKCVKATFLDQIRIGAAPSCPICRNLLDESEISNITNGISSVLPTSDVHNEFDSPHSAEIPFECFICEESPDHPSDRIFLIKCKHQVCLKCLKEKILAQMKWAQTPMCPVCKQVIDPVQLVGFGFSKVSRVAVELEEPSTCFLCKHRIQQKIDLKNCGHEFCGQCIQEFTTKQQSEGFAPSCPTCRKLIKNDQFIEFQSLSPVSRTYNVPQNSESKTPVKLNKQRFECPRCDKMIDSECGISLKNCEHLFCRDCISNIISERSKINLVPICPLCETRITVEEVHALGSEVNAIPIENQPVGNISARRHEVETQRRDGLPSSDNRICIGCNETTATYALSNCNDRFCRPCIKNVLNNQSLNNKLPSCPKCSRGVTGQEVNELCGNDVYNRFVAIYRNK